MKKNYFLLILMFVCVTSFAQTEWTGPSITITKADFADWTLPVNQDFITSNVILTRADTRGIFNIAVETEFDNNNFLSPLDTEWAIGSIADGVGTLTFDTWDNTHSADPTSVIGVPQVLHLITDDIYIDITVTSWTQGPNSGGSGGGGYSYTRSTDNTAGLNDVNRRSVRVYPNPAQDFLQLSGVNNDATYQIYNVLGAKVLEGNFKVNNTINITELTSGIYVLRIEDYTLKFIKE